QLNYRRAPRRALLGPKTCLRFYIIPGRGGSRLRLEASGRRHAIVVTPRRVSGSVRRRNQGVGERCTSLSRRIRLAQSLDAPPKRFGVLPVLLNPLPVLLHVGEPGAGGDAVFLALLEVQGERDAPHLRRSDGIATLGRARFEGQGRAFAGLGEAIARARELFLEESVAGRRRDEGRAHAERKRRTRRFGASAVLRRAHRDDFRPGSGTRSDGLFRRAPGDGGIDLGGLGVDRAVHDRLGRRRRRTPADREREKRPEHRSGGDGRDRRGPGFHAASPWRSRSASGRGSRPMKLTKSSIGSRLSPRASTLSRNSEPTAGLSTPSARKRPKASASSTSAHLYA